ncbi:hypothetical protein WJ974_00645 [Achromobacter xylosoxidans]
MNAPSSQASTDMLYREFFQRLFQDADGESLQWTPALDACLSAYYQLQSSQSAESHPMEVMTTFGHCLGIAQALFAAGLITDRQRRDLDSFAAHYTHEKVLPWNGYTFTVTAGRGHPQGITPPTLQ